MHSMLEKWKAVLCTHISREQNFQKRSSPLHYSNLLSLQVLIHVVGEYFTLVMMAVEIPSPFLGLYFILLFLA